jgi:hypothetical protein
MHKSLSLVALFLGAPALAQEPGVPTTLNSFYPIGAASSAAHVRGAVFDADGDSLQDIAFLNGTEIEAVFAPGVFMAFFDDIGTADDVAALPEGANSDADALLSVGANGLEQRELVWTGDQASWSTTTLQSNWANAKRLDCRVLSDQTWIFGLQSNLRTVRARAKIDSSWSEGALFTTTFDATEIGAMDYQGDGTLEVCVVGGSRWEIWARNGAAFNPWVRVASGVQSGYTLLDLAVGSQSGNSADWVAFLGYNNEQPARSCVIVRDQAGTQAPEEIDGSPNAIAIETGDVSEDGHDDLVLSIRADPVVLVAVNQSTETSPAFDGTRTSTPPAQPPTITVEMPITADNLDDNSAHPLVADFDNDFDVDFCLAIEPPGGSYAHLFVFRDHLSGAEPAPALALVANACGGITVRDEDLGICSSNCLVLPVTANLSGPPYDAVESFLWKKTDAAAYTTPGSICWHQEEIASPTTVDCDMALASNPGFLGTGTPRDGTIYYFMVCYAELNTSGAVTGIFRPQVYGFQTQCASGGSCTAEELLDDYASGAQGEMNSWGCEGGADCSEEEGPGIWTGSFVPVP